VTSIRSIGGVSIFSGDPRSLAEWYASHLGLRAREDRARGSYYCDFYTTDPENPDVPKRTVWTLLPSDDDTPPPSDGFVLSYVVHSQEPSNSWGPRGSRSIESKSARPADRRGGRPLSKPWQINLRVDGRSASGRLRGPDVPAGLSPARSPHAAFRVEPAADPLQRRPLDHSVPTTPPEDGLRRQVRGEFPSCRLPAPLCTGPPAGVNVRGLSGSRPLGLPPPASLGRETGGVANS